MQPLATCHSCLIHPDNRKMPTCGVCGFVCTAHLQRDQAQFYLESLQAWQLSCLASLVAVGPLLMLDLSGNCDTEAE
jgi:hypothetical protein